MKNERINLIKSFVLGLSMAFVFFSIDGAFSIQSIIIPFVLLLILGIINHKSITKKNIIIIVLFLGLFCLSNLYSYIFDRKVINTDSIVRIFTSLGCIVFYVLITSNDKSFFSTKKYLRLTMLLHIIVGTIVSLYLIIQNLLGAEGKIGIDTLFGNYIDPNVTGGIVILSLCITTYFFVYDKYKIVYGIIYVIQLFGAFFTGSRSILVGYLAFIGVAILIYIVKNRSVKTLVIVGLILILMITFYFSAEYILPDYFYDRFFGSYIDASNIDRLKLWWLGLKGFARQPILGYGPGNYNYYVLIEWPNHLNVVSHNSYIDILVDTGVVGLGLYVYLFFDRSRNLIKNKIVNILPFIATFLVITIIISAIRTWLFWYNLGLISLIIDYFTKNPDKSYSSLFNSNVLEYEINDCKKPKIACVTVLYNPTLENINNIYTYLNNVDKLFLIDNSDVKTTLLDELSKNDKVEYIFLNGNKGLGIALNIGMQRAIESQYKYVMTMDQDSHFPSDYNFTNFYTKIISNPSIACLSPSYSFDRGKKVVQNNEVKKVLWTMQSACIFNMDIFKEIGFFEEKFFIDMIDYEYCLRANKYGYLICQDCNSILYHSPGITKKTFYGYKYGYCSPERLYYQVRNANYTYSIYRNVKIKIIIWYKLFKVIFFFDNKKRYLSMYKKGKLDFKNNKFGKCCE